MIYKDFYAEVGKLLYALAKVDGSISQQEIDTIHQLVLKKMVPLETSTDEFGTDSAFYIEMEFDFLNENFHDPEAAFESFMNYFKDHFTAFNDHHKEVVFEVAETLILAYHETNIRDHYMILELKNLLTSDKVVN